VIGSVIWGAILSFLFGPPRRIPRGARTRIAGRGTPANVTLLLVWMVLVVSLALILAIEALL